MENNLNSPINYVDLTPEEIAEREIWDAELPEKNRSLVENARRAAYQQIADPLFFKYQAGEVSKEEWLAARALVVEQNPYPDGV